MTLDADTLLSLVAISGGVAVGFFRGALGNESEIPLGFIAEYAIVPGPF